MASAPTPTNPWARPLSRLVEGALGAGVAVLALALAGASRQALADPLTGLANRRALARAWAAGGRSGRLFFIDLQGFKAVNDALGHAAGDAVLCRVAARLARAAGRAALVFRVGGDEFAVLAPGAAGGAAGARLAAALDGLEPPGVGLWLGETCARGQPLQRALAEAEADLVRRRCGFNPGSRRAR